jgi:hypothetical protein
MPADGLAVLLRSFRLPTIAGIWEENVIADERLEVHFALDEEVPANPGELVRPVFCHLQGKLLDLPAVN